MNKLTPEYIESRIATVDYVVLPNRRTTVCSLTLSNGFVVVGSSSCVHPDNFDQKIGEQVSRADAVRQIWQLEGYLLREHLFGK